MKTFLLLITLLGIIGCSREPYCIECRKGTDVIELCDGEHSREAYLYQSQGYTCRTY